MRFNTYNAVSSFVSQLQDADIVRHFYDDGDMMYFSLKTGERIMGYLVERAFSLQNLEHHLLTNTNKGRYSLFMFDADMFLPASGDVFEMTDWMEAMALLQNNVIYGYEVVGRDSFFFPVYFDGVGRIRRIRHGSLINPSRLHGQTVQRTQAPLVGHWRIATFAEAPELSDAVKPIKDTSPLGLAYAVLGIAKPATVAEVKQAYRSLARLHHPDVNTAPDAAKRMMEINQAYQLILDYLAKS